MKNLTLAACFVSAFLISSCSNSDTAAYDNTIAPANDTNKVAPVTIVDSVTGINATAQQSTATTLSSPTPQMQPQVQMQPQTQTNIIPAASKKMAGLNPEHGQPGHRCDIAVGAPLSSAPAAAPASTTPVITPQAVQAKPSAITPAITGGGKLNPPHGEPGHDCAKQVGAPL